MMLSLDLRRSVALALAFLSVSTMTMGRLTVEGRALAMSSSTNSSSSDPPTVYEKLEAFGFPAGLLPHTAVDYTLDPNGKFTVALDRTCSALLQGTYLVTYDSQISGTVSPGRIKSLRGVSVGYYSIGFSISGIRVNHQDLVFEVGFVSAKFPISNFDEAPECEKSGSVSSL